MNEEIFLKKHWSLKGKILHAFVPPEIVVTIENIHKTQLDRKRVKEVVDNPKYFPVVLKLRAEDYISYSEKCYKAERHRIKKELGLIR